MSSNHLKRGGICGFRQFVPEQITNLANMPWKENHKFHQSDAGKKSRILLAAHEKKIKHFDNRTREEKLKILLICHGGENCELR